MKQRIMMHKGRENYAERIVMKKETIGKLSSDLVQKTPDTTDPVELERAMHESYEQEIFTCIERGKKDFPSDFFVVVITKKERLMKNVLRNYFYARQTCPTPDYDQTVYHYHRSHEKIEFLWTIPAKDICIEFLHNALMVHPEEKDLLKYVLDFADGTLYTKCKTLNGEQIDSPLLIKE